MQSFVHFKSQVIDLQDFEKELMEKSKSIKEEEEMQGGWERVEVKEERLVLVPPEIHSWTNLNYKG